MELYLVDGNRFFFIYKIESYVRLLKNTGHCRYKTKSYVCICNRNKLVSLFIKSNHIQVYVAGGNW